MCGGVLWRKGKEVAVCWYPFNHLLCKGWCYIMLKGILISWNEFILCFCLNLVGNFSCCFSKSCLLNSLDFRCHHLLAKRYCFWELPDPDPVLLPTFCFAITMNIVIFVIKHYESERICLITNFIASRQVLFNVLLLLLYSQFFGTKAYVRDISKI